MRERSIAQYIVITVMFSFSLSLKAFAFEELDVKKAITEIESKCDGDCNNFLLQNFKNQIINNLNNSKNFFKKLSNDISWAIENNCTSEAEDVNELVDIVSGRTEVKVRKKPKCRFKYFNSIENKDSQSSKVVVKEEQPEFYETPTYFEQPYNDNCGTGCYEEVIECAPGRCQGRFPFLRSIANRLNLVKRVREYRYRNHRRNHFNANSASLGGVDVGGGRVVDPRYIYQVGGVDVGGGKIAPESHFHKVQTHSQNKELETLLEKKHQATKKIAKYLTLRDYLIHKKKSGDLKYKDYSPYLKYQGINSNEIKGLCKEGSEESVNAKIKSLKKEREVVVKKLKSQPLLGTQFFSAQDREELSKEFIYHLGSKLVR